MRKAEIHSYYNSVFGWIEGTQNLPMPREYLALFVKRSKLTKPIIFPRLFNLNFVHLQSVTVVFR